MSHAQQQTSTTHAASLGEASQLTPLPQVVSSAGSGSQMEGLASSSFSQSTSSSPPSGWLPPPLEAGVGEGVEPPEGEPEAEPPSPPSFLMPASQIMLL